jgi:hypothetical protein
MSIDPKAMEAARKDALAIARYIVNGNAITRTETILARALLAGEGPDNGRGSMAAGGKSHVNGTEPHKCTPAARSPSPAVRDAPGWAEAIEAAADIALDVAANWRRVSGVAAHACHEIERRIRALHPSVAEPDAPKEEQ